MTNGSTLVGGLILDVLPSTKAQMSQSKSPSREQNTPDGSPKYLQGSSVKNTRKKLVPGAPSSAGSASIPSTPLSAAVMNLPGMIAGDLPFGVMGRTPTPTRPSKKAGGLASVLSSTIGESSQVGSDWTGASPTGNSGEDYCSSTFKPTRFSGHVPGGDNRDARIHRFRHDRGVFIVDWCLVIASILGTVCSIAVLQEIGGEGNIFVVSLGFIFGFTCACFVVAHHVMMGTFRRDNKDIPNTVMWRQRAFFCLEFLCALAAPVGSGAELSIDIAGVKPTYHTDTILFIVVTPARALWIWRIAQATHLLANPVRGLITNATGVPFDDKFTLKMILWRIPIPGILFSISLVVLLTGLLANVAEKPLAEEHKYLWNSWWLVIVTLTTVGYGDTSPITAVGQATIVAGIMLGLAATALLTASLTRSVAWNQNEHRAVTFLAIEFWKTKLRTKAASAIQAWLRRQWRHRQLRAQTGSGVMAVFVGLNNAESRTYDDAMESFARNLSRATSHLQNNSFHLETSIRQLGTASITANRTVRTLTRSIQGRLRELLKHQRDDAHALELALHDFDLSPVVANELVESPRPSDPRRASDVNSAATAIGFEKFSFPCTDCDDTSRGGRTVSTKSLQCGREQQLDSALKTK